jgi:hypothetical protein
MSSECSGARIEGTPDGQPASASAIRIYSYMEPRNILWEFGLRVSEPLIPRYLPKGRCSAEFQLSAAIYGKRAKLV